MVLNWKENRQWAENRTQTVARIRTYTMNGNKTEANTSLVSSTAVHNKFSINDVINVKIIP
jgi:hypothetical protein